MGACGNNITMWIWWWDFNYNVNKYIQILLNTLKYTKIYFKNLKIHLNKP